MTWMAPRPCTDTTRPVHWVPPGQASCTELRGWPAVCGAAVAPLQGMDREFGTMKRPVCEVCASAASDPYQGGYPHRRSSSAA